MTSGLELIRNSIQATVFYLAPRLSNVVLFILIGWRYGPEDAGIYTLGVTFLLILNVATRGMDDLIIRESAQVPQDAEQLLLRFGLLRLGLVALLYGGLAVLLFWGLGYSVYASSVILIMALVAFPETLMAIAQSILVGLGDFKTPSWVIGLTNVAKLVLGAVIALNTGSLTMLAWSAVVSYGIGALFMLRKLVATLDLGAQVRWPNFATLFDDLRTSLPFMGITGLVGTEGQMDVILLSLFRSEGAVGWYGAATTITSSFAILSQAYRQSVYPAMARFVVGVESLTGAGQSQGALYRLYGSSLRYLAILAFPMAAGTIVIAPTLIPTLFGPAFEPTITIVQILSIGVPLGFLTVPNSRLIFANDQQRYSLIFVAISFVINIMLNLLLVPYWGGAGAAVARTASMLLLLLCSYYFVQTRLLNENAPMNSIWTQIARPLLACGIMVAALWPIRNVGLVIPIVVGALSYGLALWGTGAIPKEDVILLKKLIPARTAIHAK